MKLFNLIPLLLCLSFATATIAQVDNAEFEKLKELTRKASQTDSVNTFTNGQLAIDAAKTSVQKAEIIKIYGDYFYNSSQFDKAAEYYEKAKKTASSGDNQSLLLSIELREYILLIEKGEFELGRKGLFIVVEKAKKNNDTINIIEGLNNLGNRYGSDNNREKALESYLEALKYATASKSSYREAFLLNNIGLLKWQNQQADEALSDFIKALKMSESIEAIRLSGHLYNNIGLIYSDKKEYEIANEYFFKFLHYAIENNLPKEMGVAYLNIGHSFYQQKEYEIAISYFDSTISRFSEHNIFYFMPKAYLGIGLTYVKTNELEKAKTNVDLGMKIATEYDLLDDISLGHKVYSDIAKGHKNYELALEEYVTYKELNDSIEKLNNKKKVAELEVQYDVEKKENALIKEKTRTELLEKEKELEKIKLRTYIVFSIIGIVVFIVLFFIRHFTILKRKQEEFSQNLIENIDIERERIAKDLHDDLGQRLSVIKNKIHLNGECGLNENNLLENEVGGIIEQTREISHQLYPSYLAKIGLDRSIAQLLKKIQEDTAFVCSYSGLTNIDNLLTLEEKTHFYRILQECINNTLKHSKAKALKVSVKKIKNGIRLTYRDNGKGLKEKKVGKGIGFMSMLERVKMLNGTMEVSANSGKGIKLIFDIHPKNNKV